MTDRQFRALLDLIMCSDPWPCTRPRNRIHVVMLADDAARERGFKDWVDAYHEMPA